MHDTKNSKVTGFIDSYKIKDNEVKLLGWCFHTIYNICELRLRYLTDDNEKIINASGNARNDVMKFYNFTTNEKLCCGWNFNLVDKNIKNIQLEMFFENEWNVIFAFDNSVIENGYFNFSVKKVSGYIPSFIVVDDFYEDVDMIRKFALTQKFSYNENYHKGKRTGEVYRFDGLKESFESILNCKIKNWNKYGVNGCFQYCVGGDQLVYHFDQQEYAGIIFLTPNAPPQTGTSFYRSRNTNKHKIDEGEFDTVFKHGFLDSTEFELVDAVGNLYNRLVLFDSQMFHAASTYFGTNLENGRLFQLFFFDLDR